MLFCCSLLCCCCFAVVFAVLLLICCFVAVANIADLVFVAVAAAFTVVAFW